jgi:hypothetical protein
VHRGGLDGDQRRERFGVLEDDLSYEPWVYMTVIAAQKNTTAPSLFAPARYVCDSPKIVRRSYAFYMGTDGEDVKGASSCR